MNDEDVRLLRDRMTALRRRQRREEVPIAGLSQSAVRVLSATYRLGGSTQPAQLADDTQMTSSNVAAALRELEAGALVRRERDDEDARRVNVHLTPAGSQMVVETRGIRDAWLAKAIGALLDDREQQLLAEASELIGRLAGYAR
jgi:DNA-binding MarR family transcriptional regulator